MSISIELIQDKDLPHIAEMCKEIFKGHDTMAANPIVTQLFTQLEVSYKAVLNGQIIGCYIMNDDGIGWLEHDYTLYEDLSPYSQKEGINGVVLAIKPEFRGLGYGKALRELPRKMQVFDYVWGFHVKSLNNIDNWIRYGRRIVGESDTCYLTLMDL